MRKSVIFKFPAELIPVSEEDGILSTTGALWFRDLLNKVPHLEVDNDLLQEDWGVAILARRNNKRFWIGLNFWDENTWLAHFHHRTFALLQRLTGTSELNNLVFAFHDILKAEAQVSGIEWYEQKNLAIPGSQSSPTP